MHSTPLAASLELLEILEEDPLERAIFQRHKMLIAGLGKRKCTECGAALRYSNPFEERCSLHQSRIIDPSFLGAREISEQRKQLLKESLPKDKLPDKKNHFVAGKSQQKRLPLQEVA